ncbi:hypothetical protein CBG49_00245 [Capnocytophaga endodontalis]|uniref:Uncharacterized protein n=1 Tax=Capnocytophaga endodontalis TaxID=2708117 RepID=A0A1Z4BK20_9FLAO|nr:hypothetical protein CBG49_00245 [Capnocytophaga endodontalis]
MKPPKFLRDFFMIFGKIFFNILIIRWDIWEVWNENLGKALTHLLGRWRECGSGGSGGSCGSSGYSWKGSEKTQLFSLNSFSHFAIISASGIVFKKPLANKKLKLS